MHKFIFSYAYKIRSIYLTFFILFSYKCLSVKLPALLLVKKTQTFLSHQGYQGAVKEEGPFFPAYVALQFLDSLSL